MADLLRGEIYWADLDPTEGHEQSGHRPVLIVSDDIFNARSGTVIAIAMTSQEPKAPFPLSLEIVGSGLPKRSWAKIGQIRTLSTLRLGARICEATPEELSAVLEGLDDILGR